VNIDAVFDRTTDVGNGAPSDPWGMEPELPKCRQMGSCASCAAGEHGIPVVGVPGGQAERRRVLDERDPLDALVRHPADLLHRGGHIPDRQDHQRHETVRCGGAPLVDDEVVPGLHAEEAQIPVRAVGREPPPTEAGQARERRLRPHPVDVHVAHALDRVVAAHPHVGEAVGIDPELLPLLAGDGVQPDLRIERALVGPDGAAFRQHTQAIDRLATVGHDHPRREVVVPRRQTVEPHGGVLDDVVVDGDQHHVILQWHLVLL
jgi:hypothetical protein